MNTIKHLFTALLLLCATVATAHDFEVNGIYYNITNATNPTVEVTYKGTSYSQYSNEYTGSVVVPESVIYNGTTYSVTSIGNSAFEDCTGLTSIEIPNSITSIGDRAFYNCSGLTSIEIPNSVTSIGYMAFWDCTGLKVVHISDIAAWCSIGFSKAYANPLYYAKNLYLNGELVTEITIPNSVTSIGNYAFYECTWLTSITIPNSVTSIGRSAFCGCSMLTTITIPNSVTSIGDYAFDNCTGLKKAIWLTNTPPSGYKNVGATYNYVANNEYSGLSNVKVYSYLSSIFEVDGVKYVPVSPAERTCDAIDCAYNDTTSVDIVIGKTVSYKGISMNVKEIMPYALYANKKIKSVKCENSGSIGDYAFSGCTALTTANISNKGYVGNYAFSGCTALTAANISNKGSIGSCAFSGCYDFAEATLGDGVTSIGTEAFSNCKALGNIVIPDAVTSLGSKTFHGCSSLKSAEIGVGVTTINEATFSGCSAMTSITIGDNVKTIGKNAFYGCSSLAEVAIPQSVTKIADYVFDNCSSLADVVIENDSTVLSLGSNGSSPLFADCPLDSVYIGRKINYSTSSYYGYSPFYRNTSLRIVVITDTETEIYDNEFYGCSNLKNVTIGNGVNKIGKWAFSGCGSLDYFAFGDNVQSIGEEAFSDCNNVTKILTSAMTPPVCGTQALDDINKWNCSLYVPSEAKSAYQQAEQWRDFFFVEDLPASIGEVFEDVKGESGNVKAIYDLQGRVVENPTSGIYIIDGKKVLVK